MEHLLVAGTFIFVFLFCIGFILYLLQGIGLYKIGSNMGIEYSWFSFIPFLNLYVWGSIVSQVKILDYTIGQLGLVLPISAVIGMVMSGVPVLGWLVNIALIILWIYVLIYFFRKFDPRNTAVKTVVSIILPFMLPIFLFLMRNDKPIQSLEEGS